ncbi:G patch domain and ankyrin repeat-containing protein 1 homolog [Aphidius gifuensis]|nr:G patch domain and ankyrin repeat-containing protein 1 homolog [Aphidius gifuensis]
MDFNHWKIFIKQSENVADKINDKHIGKLNFKGEEAKIAYETIIKESCNNEKSAHHQLIDKQKTTIVKIVNNKTPIIENKNIDVNVVLIAVEQGDLNYIENNLSKNNVNIVDYFGWTPLMSAAYSGSIKIVEYLLKLGADKKLADKSGNTALDLAKKKHHTDIIIALKKSNLNDNNKNYHSHDEHDEITSLYCEICKTNFTETTRKKHEASILHIFNTKPVLPDPIYGLQKDNRGYQIMLNNGWNETQGLGPTGTGLKYPIKTVLKRDRKGFSKESTKNSRITHFSSFDSTSIAHVKKLHYKNKTKPLNRKDRAKVLSYEAKKQRDIRRALS